jgi:uncharacterized protein
MDITPVIPKEMLVLSRYGNGGFVINEQAHPGNILLLPTVVAPWNGDISEAAFADIWNADPAIEIMLIGTGATFSGPSAELRALFRSHHILMDMMDTGAACRTYNVLLSEGRRVATALIAV